ncbi:hypothetical protein [Micromonospora coerulea]|nr:hypothetical protein [Micromonospora veneta]
MPRLVPITTDNVLAACAIAVRPDQEGLVAPVARSLAEATSNRTSPGRG